MLFPLYKGLKYNYCYEVETSHYLLSDNENKKEVYLQGDDAKIFYYQIMSIDELKYSKNKTQLLTDNLLSSYL